MSHIITEEAGFLLRSLVWGLTLGAVYDVVQWLGQGIFSRKWWRGLQDLLYWTICAVLLFAMIRQENGGTIRWYALAGAAAGASVYYVGIRPVIHRLLRPVWILATKPLHFVENLLKKRKKSVILKDKVESGVIGAERGSKHG